MAPHTPIHKFRTMVLCLQVFPSLIILSQSQTPLRYQPIVESLLNSALLKTFSFQAPIGDQIHVVKMVPTSIILTTIGWLASPIFKKVADVAWQQFTKRVGLQAEIDDMIAELKSFRVPNETAETKGYLKEVKELINEAKDLLDELDYFRLQKEVKQMNKAEQGNILSKLTSPSDVPSSSTKGTFKELKFDKHGMSKRMKDLIKKLQKTCASPEPRLHYELLSSIARGIQNMNNQVVSNDRQTNAYSFDKIYGRDGQIKDIQQLVSNAKQHSVKIPVIAIVGIGGTGKTTLAQQVFNHPPVEFDLKIWICVSTNFGEMEITRQMLEYCSGDGRKIDGENLTNLKSILVSKLKNKKVLLVLDDIWEIKNKSAWISLMAPLNSSAIKAGSTVLVTSRFLSIAKIVEAVDPIIKLDGLDESSFWSLFKNYAFGNDQFVVPRALETIGRCLVQRLRGSPLAAKTVGTLLKGNIDVVYWTKVLESDQWKFQQGNDDIIPTLRLSYDYLPIELKQCFSYCSLFPKDHYFRAKELVHMWMAQEYICTDGKKRVEDVGLDYLKTLVERAFLQTIVKEWGEVVYVLHDLMHDLAEVVSSETILAIKQSEPIPFPPNLCHLSFPLDMQYTTENHVKFQNLFSLIIFKDSKALCNTINWHQANKFHLRLLILPFMSSISYNFTHLRYLKLYSPMNYGEVVEFPVQICRLYHLQVLQLDDKLTFFKGLPKEFNNLVNLRYFIANAELHCKIAEVGRLKCLQELKIFVVREEKGFELGQLSKLNELRGSLEIHSLQNVKSRDEAECIRLSEKEIEELELWWDKEIEDEPQLNRRDKGKWRTWLNGKGKECRTTVASLEEILDALQPSNQLRCLSVYNYGGKSPSWLTNHSIKYLESIRLSHCEAWKELPNFGQLVCLKELYLKHLPRVKAIGPQFYGCGPHDSFPSLKVMDVSHMDELETWDWDEQYNVFPFLEKLHVSACPQLVKFSLLDPVKVHKESTERFPMLEQLKIRDCSQLQQGKNTEYIRSKDKLTIKHAEGPKVLFLIFRISKNIRCMEFKYCSNLTSLLWKCICMIHGLKELRFDGCHELCFSQPIKENDDGSTSYSHESLQELMIDKCSVTGEELSYLLAHVPVLCKLSISRCNRIDPVSLTSNMVEPNRSSLEADVEVDKDQQQSPDSLICLEELYIQDCPNLVFVNEGGLSVLTAVKKVSIEGSDKLLYSLDLEKGSNYVHHLSVKKSNVTSLNLYSFVALRKLMLLGCKDLASVEGPNSPASLEVFIENCPRLAQTPSQIEPKFVIAVEKLNIDNMEFLSIHANRFSRSLRSLTINGFFTQLKLSEWTEDQEVVVIKQLTALEELTLYDCKELRSLPSTLHLHPSLKELNIYNSPEIKSLPQRGFPQSLQKLLLNHCSEELKSQCSQLKDFEFSHEAAGKWGYTCDVFSKRDPSAN